MFMWSMAPAHTLLDISKIGFPLRKLMLCYYSMGAMAGAMDPSALMGVKQEEVGPEEELGEACVLDTFNCDLNCNIDENG